MSTACPPAPPAARERSSCEDRLLWLGLSLSLLALALVASLEGPRVLGYAAFGPEDLKAWAAAAAAAAGSISTAVSVSIIGCRKVVQFARWMSDRRRRRRRRKGRENHATPAPQSR